MTSKPKMNTTKIYFIIKQTRIGTPEIYERCK